MNTAVRVASVASAVAVAAPSIAAEVPVTDPRSPKQILARFQQAISFLRTGHVANHFTVDKDNATRALRWFEQLASGARTLADDSDEFGFVVGFIGEYKLSFDWIFDGDPALLICGHAALSDRARACQPADPIFAAIDGHREAFKQTMDAVYVLGRINSAKNPAASNAADKACGAGWALFRKATEEIVTVQPTSMAGVHALVDYVAAFDRGAFVHPRSKNNHSEHGLWPEGLFVDDKVSDRALPFAYFLVRNVLAGLEAVSGMGQRSIKPTPPQARYLADDPVFSLIETHRDDEITFRVADNEHTLLDEAGARSGTKKAMAALRRAERKLYKVWGSWADHLKQIVECEPTTKLGVQAKFQHLHLMLKSRAASDGDFDMNTFRALVKATMVSV